MAISLGGYGINIDRLYHGQPAGGTIYTSPTGGAKRTVVTSIRIANPSDSDLTARLGIIPVGGSSDGTHYLLGDFPIPGHDTYESDAQVIMRAGDTLEGSSASLPAPTGLTAVPVPTGGTIAAGPQFLKITGTNANGETVASLEASCTTTGTTSSIVLAWVRLLGVTGYRVWGSTATGAEVLLATGAVVSGGSTVTTTITSMTAAAGPVSPPAAGTAAGCIFTICGAELPA